MTIPHWLSTILAWTLSLGPVATILWWGSILVRVEHSLRTIPTLRLGQKLARDRRPAGQVCVVVPAHNESRVIAGMVRSLRAETYPQLRFVLALDRCTDDTASIARNEIGSDERFELVEIAECPPDWSGKVHAVHAAVTRSRGSADADYLIFADADTLFTPGCIAASIALMAERSVDLLSLLSTLTYDTWFERVVQTAAAFELMQQFPLNLANARENRRAFANGQYLLFRRDAYAAVGGHAAVKGALLEDLALARLIEAKGRNTGVFLAAGMFCCRMYGDWQQFQRGWKRIYTESADRDVSSLAWSAVRVRWLGTFLPAWNLVAGAYGALLVARDARPGWTLLALSLGALLLWVGTLARICVASRAPVWIAPLHMVGAWLTANLLRTAASDLRSRKAMRWGGREYGLSAADAQPSTVDAGNRAAVRSTGK